MTNKNNFIKIKYIKHKNGEDMEDIFKSWLVETPIAHRGLHDKTSPENSLSAFEKAVENGYAIELDVQLLADDTVVVFHDESLSRMTGNDGYLKFLNKEDLKVLNLAFFQTSHLKS